MANQAKITLSIQEPGKAPRTVEFSQPTVTLGKGDAADLKVDGEGISEVHAMFDASKGEEVNLMDLGSVSGTFVNGDKVTKQKMELGSSLKIGDVEIKVTGIGASTLESKEEPKKAEPQPEPVVEAKPEPTPEPEPVVEAKPEPAPAPKAPKKAESKADEERRLMEEKRQAFQAKKAEARRKAGQRMLQVIPTKVEVPESQKTVFEARQVLWGDTLVSMEHLDGGKIYAGEAKDCMFSVPEEVLGSTRFELAAKKGGSWQLQFNDKMNGRLMTKGGEQSFQDLIKGNKAQREGDGYSLTVDTAEAVHYDMGTVQFYFRHADKAKVEKSNPLKTIDYPITILFTILMATYVGAMLYMNSLPVPEVADILDAPDRFAKLVLDPLEEEEPPPPPEEEKKQFLKESGDKAIGEEGKVGKEEAKLDKASGSARKALDEKVANSAGILGALDSGVENMEMLFGGGALGAGLDKNLGMLEGVSGLDMRGAGGLGLRGAGFGGGGSALGIGGLGTWGRGGGRGRGRYGFGAAGKLKKKSGNIGIRTGSATVQGSLDKSLIARIIKRHYSQIRYCYQKELQANPKLYGKITVQFIIGPTGTVQSSRVKVSTMKNGNVENCVAMVIKRIVFPQPRGGGIVVVNYPFLFSTTN